MSSGGPDLPCLRSAKTEYQDPVGIMPALPEQSIDFGGLLNNDPVPVLSLTCSGPAKGFMCQDRLLDNFAAKQTVDRTRAEIFLLRARKAKLTKI